jgi:hypothetical protein
MGFFLYFCGGWAEGAGWDGWGGSLRGGRGPGLALMTKNGPKTGNRMATNPQKTHSPKVNRRRAM